MTSIHTCKVWTGPIPGVHAVQMFSDRAFDRHWHDTFGFGLMDEGGQVSASGRGQVRALAGQIITTNPGEVHDGVPLEKHARRWRMVFVMPDVLSDLVGASNVELIHPVLDDAVLHRTCDALFRRWDPTAEGCERSAHEELLAQAVGLLVGRHGGQPCADLRRTSLGPIRECLLDQRGSPPSLAVLAELAGLSRYQLVRQFSQAHGLPPFAWLQQHRVQQARDLISRGATLADAALNSGFSDQSHLTRAFKRYLGYTPGTWQRAHRGGLQ